MERERDSASHLVHPRWWNEPDCYSPITLSHTTFFFLFATESKATESKTPFSFSFPFFFWCVRVKVRFFKLARDHLTLSWLIAHCEL